MPGNPDPEHMNEITSEVPEHGVSGAHLRLYLLGRLELAGQDPASAHRVLAGDLRTAVLSILGLALPGAVRRDFLVGIFWPDATDREARHRLRQVLYVLRTALGEDAFLMVGAEQAGLNPARVWCDAAELESALRCGDDARAVDLYGGPLCEGLLVATCPGFERWLSGKQEQVQEQVVRAAWRLSDQAAALGDLRAACRYGADALRLLPDEDRLHTVLQMYERSGDRIGALRLAGIFERTVVERYDMEPSPATRAIVHRIAHHPPPAPPTVGLPHRWSDAGARSAE
jgi:DNA-binding SARP family transcriptional activator